MKENSNPDIKIFLIGNKVDLEERRQVTYEEGSIYAEKNGMLFFETSAKTGKNIEEIFIKSSYEIAKKIESGFYDLSNDSCGIKLGFSSETITLNANKNGSEQSNGYCC